MKATSKKIAKDRRIELVAMKLVGYYDANFFNLYGRGLSVDLELAPIGTQAKVISAPDSATIIKVGQAVVKTGENTVAVYE